MGQDPQSWADDPQVGGEHSCRGSPQRGEESDPVSGSANRGSNTGTVSPQNFQRWKPAGLEYRRVEGLQDTDCAFQISQALSPKAEAASFKKPGSEPLADLSLPERQETTGNPPGNKSTRGSLLGGLLTLVMSLLFWSPPSRLSAPDTQLPINRPRPVPEASPTGSCPKAQLCPPVEQQPPQGAGPVTYEPYGDYKPKTY